MSQKTAVVTDSRKARGDGYANLVKGMEITEPFQVLSSDISYVRTQEGFDYICQIRDVTSGIILAHTIKEHMRADLVTDTIRKMIRRWAMPAGCIFHSDRGSQFTSEAVRNPLASKGFRQSYSRVGKPGDNAWSESFFTNLKKEAVHWRFFHSRDEARQAIFAYIDKSTTPGEYKNDLATKAGGVVETLPHHVLQYCRLTFHPQKC